MTIAVRGFRVFVLAAFLLAPTYAVAQESKSAALATELSNLLDAMKLDSVAASSGSDPRRNRGGWRRHRAPDA